MTSPRPQLHRIGVWQLKAAVVYLALGLLLGLYMAVSGNFDLRPVHTHLNLLGWSALGFTGLVYCLIPQLAETRNATLHVWLHNAGLPLMMAGLTLYVLGYREFEPLLGIGAVLASVSLLVFGYNVLMTLRARESTQP